MTRATPRSLRRASLFVLLAGAMGDPHPASAQANDACLAATQVLRTSLPFTDLVDTSTAIVEVDDPIPSCDFVADYTTVVAGTRGRYYHLFDAFLSTGPITGDLVAYAADSAPSMNEKTIVFTSKLGGPTVTSAVLQAALP